MTINSAGNYHTEVYVIGDDNGLWLNRQDTEGAWSGFANLGGYAISNPAGVYNIEGRAQVFVPDLKLMTCLRKDMVRSLFGAGDMNVFLKAIRSLIVWGQTAKSDTSKVRQSNPYQLINSGQLVSLIKSEFYGSGCLLT